MRESFEAVRPNPPKADLRQAHDSIAPDFLHPSHPLRQSILTWLKSHVPETRIRHILRVEQLAIALAQHHHLEVEKAAQAALMHDLAKFFKPQRLLQMVADEGLTLDPVDEANPHLLHAAAGAIVARDEFGIQDAEVLHAIRDHTLGRPGMGRLSCVVYLADGLEPGRGNTPELVALRQISHRDLDEAIWRASDHSLKHLLNAHHLIHPRTVLTRNWFMQAVTHKPPKKHPPDRTSPASAHCNPPP
ncbi:MAG: HD domain-containing protein [Leptolyngbyaceae cyanobacterium CSU_1_3]|nr:HD domain-containing protein [Leptolyngbyaceae cyanobacterium CSU_1_3]